MAPSSHSSGLANILLWLPLGFAITVIIGFVYVAAQLGLRQSVNDPQIQLAQDAATQLAAGVSPATVIPPATVDIATSLAPYVIVYAHDGAPLAGSGRLEGQIPTPPIGVLQSVPVKGMHLLTWAPRPSIRQGIAVVSVGDAGGTVVIAGRSLREEEARDQMVRGIASIAWLVTIIGSLLLHVFAQSVRTKRSS